MKAVIALYFFIVSSLTQFHQNSYKIMHDRVDNINCNKSMMRRPDFKVLNLDDAVQVLNGSGILRTTLTEVILKPSVYRHVGNAYRILPIDFAINTCEPNKKNVLGLRSILNHTNFRRCPIQPGYYYLNKYKLEEDKFPPHIPFGDYKLVVNIYTTNQTFLCSGEWYGTVARKNDE
ncbi:hypothetical protein FQR65_LT09337 [Abscondita terminalis]|nr:hypothetical protein FQR65_LT09337 [Abscondita terminalis]